MTNNRTSLRNRVRSYLERRLDVPTIPSALDRLLGGGFAPRLVFDIGAYHGEFADLCLQRWPTADVSCFEPAAKEAQYLIQRFGIDERVRVFSTLVGARERTDVILHLNDTGSSVLADHSGVQRPTQACTMRTVDAVVVEEHADRAPDLLKIDVQGYELDVLEGAEHSLARISAILVETNLIDVYEGAALLPKLMAWLDARGWVPYDVCGLIRRPLDRALWQADFVFVQREHELRRDKRWGVK